MGSGDYDMTLIALDLSYIADVANTDFKILLYQEISAPAKIITYHNGSICDLATSPTGKCKQEFSVYSASYDGRISQTALLIVTYSSECSQIN